MSELANGHRGRVGSAKRAYVIMKTTAQKLNRAYISPTGALPREGQIACHRRGPFSSRSTTKARRKGKEKNTILNCEPWRKIPSKEKEGEGGGGGEEEDDDDENMQGESHRTRKRRNSRVCEGRA